MPRLATVTPTWVTDKQASRIGQQIERRLRAGVPVFGHLPQPRMPHGKQRHLRGGEEAVDRNKK